MATVIILIASYLGLQIFSDIGSLKIVMLAGFSIDAGTFLYPFTFTLRDLVQKVMGKQATRLLILVAAVINIFMALFFWFVAVLPPDMNVGNQTAFGAVLSPVWRLVVASIVAEVLSEFTDTEIYSLWVKKMTTRYQWSRVLVSNSVSIPLDSLLFSWLAFGGALENKVVWSIFVSNVLIKFIATFISLPSIYLVKERPDKGLKFKL
jgi:queuosine precursor transporter